MLPSCRELRELWLARAPQASAHALARDARMFDEHRALCGECAEFARRAGQIERALTTLARKSAPKELDGLVVAALHEGQRQDRAARALASLGRVHAPAELEHKVLGDRSTERDLDADADFDAGRLHAPTVLERLVDEELREPEKSLVRRFAGRLPRLAAPAELDERVHRELIERRAPRRGVFARVTLLRAAAVALVGGASLAAFAWMLRAWTRADVPPIPHVVGQDPFTDEGVRDAGSSATPFPGLRVVHVESLAELGPVASVLGGALSGGLADAASPEFRGEAR